MGDLRFIQIKDMWCQYKVFEQKVVNHKESKRLGQFARQKKIVLQLPGMQKIESSIDFDSRQAPATGEQKHRDIKYTFERNGTVEVSSKNLKRDDFLDHSEWEPVTGENEEAVIKTALGNKFHVGFGMDLAKTHVYQENGLLVIETTAQ